MLLASIFNFLLFQFTPIDSIPSKAADYYIINTITLNGNKVTKQHIILRELAFSKNDTLHENELAKAIECSKKNLLNTSLFNFVTIDTLTTEDKKINIFIDLQERWYTWPVPIFEIVERNFNTWLLNPNLSRANYGFYLTRDNFRGRKESLSIKVRMGYAEQYGISYQVPYINKQQTTGLGFSASYSRNREIAYRTINNQLQFYKNPEQYVREELSSKATYYYRQGIYNTHRADISFNKGNIADTVRFFTSDYFISNQTKIRFLTAGYYFKRDFRDAKAYPLNGYFFDAEIIKLGLGILKNESLNLIYVQGSVKKYISLFNRTYFSTSLKGKLSAGQQQPYYVQRGLGFHDYVRGYEYYVIDGQNYGLMKTSLKYQLIKPTIQKFSFLKWEKANILLEKFNTIHYAVYAGFFSDMGYVKDRINYAVNPLANTWLVGAGIGIDFVTYYDTVFRLEYSFNRKKENGIFLHLSSPI